MQSKHKVQKSQQNSNSKC